MFLVNSRLGLFAAAPFDRSAPSPEVAGRFCRVPWPRFARSPRYALPAHLRRSAVRARAPLTLSGFSGTAPQRGSLDRFPPGTGFCTRDFPRVRPPFGDGGVQNPAPPRRRRRRVAGRARCRNVHLPSFGLGSRLTLRPRLTLGGLAFPRKPRAFGGSVARASLATRASILTSRRSTGPRRAGFAAPGKLPYRWGNNASIPPLRLAA